MSISIDRLSDFRKAFLEVAKRWVNPRTNEDWYESLNTGQLATETICIPCINAIATGEVIPNHEAEGSYNATSTLEPGQIFRQQGSRANRHRQICIHPDEGTDYWYITRALLVCQRIIKADEDCIQDELAFTVACRWNGYFIEYIRGHASTFLLDKD